MKKRWLPWTFALFLGAILTQGGACRSTGGDSTREQIAITGPDTLVNLLLRWSDTYSRQHPGTSIDVGGKGGNRLHPQRLAHWAVCFAVTKITAPESEL